MNNIENKPEGQEGLSGEPSPSEILSQMVDRLGELLHDHPNKNGNITINYYNSVGQRIDSVTTQNFSWVQRRHPRHRPSMSNPQTSNDYALHQRPTKTIAGLRHHPTLYYQREGVSEVMRTLSFHTNFHELYTNSHKLFYTQ